VYSALANSNMIVSKSIFSHNVARVYGGALYIGEQHARTTSILNSVLEFNSAYRAGGKKSSFRSIQSSIMFLSIFFSTCLFNRDVRFLVQRPYFG
jgi:hypothetical protein